MISLAAWFQTELRPGGAGQISARKQTIRTGHALDHSLLSSRVHACIVLVEPSKSSDDLDRGRALKRDLSLSTGAMVERQQLPGLSIQSHRVSFRRPGLGCFDPSTPRRLGPKAPPASADPGPGSDPQRGAASCPAGSCCSSAGLVLHNWVIRNPGGLTPEESREKTGERPWVSISCPWQSEPLILSLPTHPVRQFRVLKVGTMSHRRHLKQARHCAGQTQRGTQLCERAAGSAASRVTTH